MEKPKILVSLVVGILLTIEPTTSNTLQAASSSSPQSTSSSASSNAASAKDEVVPPPSPQGEGVQLPETLSDMGTVIPGIYREYLPQPIFYESVVPVVFQFQTPPLNKTDITFNNWYTCVTETAPYRYSCPVTFHMNQAVNNLQTDFEGHHPIGQSHVQRAEDSMKQYYERLTTHSEFCDKIQRHFAGVWTTTQDFQVYLTAIEGCSRGTPGSSDIHPVMSQVSTDYSYGIRQSFTRMENNFYNTFYKNILGSGGKNSSLDTVASALLSNARTALQGTILGLYYAEKNRWVHASQDCGQGYIPSSVLSATKFNESLVAILKLSSMHHTSELSISPRQLAKYYNLPLSDCTHTSDAFVVRVLVPILKKYRNEALQLVHVHTIPFLYKDHICRVKLPGGSSSGGNSFDDSESSMFLYNEIAQRAYHTNCKANELCKISEYLLDARRSDPCVSSLLAKNDTGIRLHCNFECLPKAYFNLLPIVVRVSSNKFVVTGNSLSLRISCGRVSPKEKLVYVKTDHIGAMLVTLSCHCRLIVPQFSVFYGGSTCSTEDITGTAQHTEYNSEADVTVSSIFPFMFTKLRPKSVLQQDKTANSVNHAHDDNDDHYFDEGQQFNLTELLDTERIETYIRSSELRRQMEEASTKGMDFYAEKLQSGHSLYADDEGSRGCGVGGWFWTIFFVAVAIILSLQAYIIVSFRRYERASYAKDERILYRVEPDTASLG